MTGPPTATAVVTALRIALALLFCAAVAGKLRRWSAFVATVGDYRLLPGLLTPLAAAGVVAGEALAAVGLAIGLAPGSLLAAGLLVLFAVAMAVNLLRGRTRLSCGCEIGGRGGVVRWRFVLRNAGLAAGLLVGLPLPSPASPAEWLAPAAGGLLLVVLGHTLEGLLTLAPPRRSAPAATAGIA